MSDKGQYGYGIKYVLLSKKLNTKRAYKIVFAVFVLNIVQYSGFYNTKKI